MNFLIDSILKGGEKMRKSIVYSLILVLLTMIFIFDSQKALAVNENTTSDLEEIINEDKLRTLEIGNYSDFLYGDEELDWAGGGANHTHQYLVGRGLIILGNDKGSAVVNKFYDTGYTSNIYTGADWPDQYETYSGTFSGHFYNPVTGKNYLGQTDPTAKTRFLYYNSLAIQKYPTDKALSMTYLGRAMHYLADLTAPHHVHNMTAVNSDHGSFESYVDTNRFSYSINSSTKYNFTSADTLAQSAANGSYNATSFTWNIDAQAYLLNNWSSSASTTMGYAQEYMAGYLYYFLKQVGEVN